MPKWKTGLLRAMLVAGVVVSEAQSSSTLVNVARRCPAVVYASGVNGHRDVDNAFYGVRNAFDGGQHVVDGITYSEWLGDETPQWVRIRFLAPLTVERIVVKAPESWEGFPDTMQVTVLTKGKPPQQFPPVELTRPGITYDLPQALENPSIITMDFSSSSVKLFGVSEIELLGKPSLECGSQESTPGLDEEFRQQLKVRAQQEAAAHDPANLLARMKQISRLLTQAAEPHQQALYWLQLNQAADEFAQAISTSGKPQEQRQALAREASTLGIPIEDCDPSDTQVARPTGYLKYLELWPKGPSADQAWWKVHMEGCGDFEGSVAEYEEAIHRYEEFLNLFPRSSYAKQAKEQLQHLRVQLQYEQERLKHDQQKLI